MPSLADLGLDVSPLREPQTYPGIAAPGDSLLLGAWLYKLRPLPGVPLGAWTVSLDGGPLNLEGKGKDSVTLDEALSHAGSAAVVDRHPVLAIGSNASPAQLHDKFGDDAHSAAVPVTRVAVVGIDVGYSLHTSKAGYVPYAPVAHTDVTRQLFMTWLDDDQLAVINDSERNYELVVARGDVVMAKLSSGIVVDDWLLYRSRWGVLCDERDGAPLRAGSQQRVRNVMKSWGGRPEDPDAWRLARTLDLAADDELDGLVSRYEFDHRPTS